MGQGAERTEYHFIVNPKARSGMGEMIWKSIEPELKKRRIAYKRYLTVCRHHAEKIAEDITSDGKEHTLAVLGGDGTVNEVINGIRDLEKVTLGYIPIGSSNDFARGLGIAKDPKTALEHVLHPEKVLRVDVGTLERPGGKRRFIVSAGIGFDAAVCHEVCVSWWKTVLNRIGLGKLSYAAVALDRLKKDRPVRLELTLSDGSRQIFENTYFAAFMNLPYEGGGFQFCPQATPCDGLLDVAVLYDISVPKILFLLPLAYFGRHIFFRGISIQKCRAAKVCAGKALPLHTDGEPGFPRKNIRVSVMDKRLKVIL